MLLNKNEQAIVVSNGRILLLFSFICSYQAINDRKMGAKVFTPVQQKKKKKRRRNESSLFLSQIYMRIERLDTQEKREVINITIHTTTHRHFAVPFSSFIMIECLFNTLCALNYETIFHLIDRIYSFFFFQNNCLTNFIFLFIHQC